MPYVGERGGEKDFEQSYCQSTTHYLNRPDLHDFLAAIVKILFIAQVPHSITVKI